MEVDVFRTASIEDNGKLGKKGYCLYDWSICDDSSDGKHERVFAVAALIGFQEYGIRLNLPGKKERVVFLIMQPIVLLVEEPTRVGARKKVIPFTMIGTADSWFSYSGNAFVMDLASLLRLCTA